MSNPIDKQLLALLDEDVRSLAEREGKELDRLTAPFSDRLVLFGAGNLGRKALRRLRAAGLEPLAFSDNDQRLWHSSIDGLIVLPPTTAAERYGQDAAFVVTIFSPGHNFIRTRRQLARLDCHTVVPVLPLFWKYPETFLPYCWLQDLPHKILAHANEVREGLSIWADGYSRLVYATHLKWQLDLDYDCLLEPSREEPYFGGKFFSRRQDEVFVDCGAYDGDTIRRFIELQHGQFRQIIALEPDVANYAKLRSYVDGLPATLRSRITTSPHAAWTESGSLRFCANGSMSSQLSHSGSVDVHAVALDDLFSDDAPTFVKMDIEGAELEALAGAKHIVHQSTPVLTICVYHRQDHLWRIPLLVRSLSSEYDLFLRSHDEEGRELVCYAIPVDRRNA